MRLFIFHKQPRSQTLFVSFRSSLRQFFIVIEGRSSWIRAKTWARRAINASSMGDYPMIRRAIEAAPALSSSEWKFAMNYQLLWPIFIPILESLTNMPAYRKLIIIIWLVRLFVGK
jgi:hypothetical protein